MEENEHIPSRFYWTSDKIAILFVLSVCIVFFGGFWLHSFWNAPDYPQKLSAPLPSSIQISPKRLAAHVSSLTSISPPRNSQHPSSLDKAASYIRSQFLLAQLPVQEQPYVVNSTTYKNLIARWGSSTGAQIIVGAHYDVCGETPGADDNASGIAGLLELAHTLSKHKPKLSYGIQFVAYTLEEPPFFATQWMGSAVHARSLVKNKIPVRAMMSLEMIGYFSDLPNSQRYPHPSLSSLYPSTGGFIAVVGDTTLAGTALTQSVALAMKSASSLPVYSLNAPSSMKGVDFSDHRSYWEQGYPAVMITDTSFYRNPHYHKLSDTPQTLNFSKMAQVTRSLYAALLHLGK